MEQVKRETIKMEEMRKQPSRVEGPGGGLLGEVIGAVLTVEVLGFWFGIGAALGSKVVHSLEELMQVSISPVTIPPGLTVGPLIFSVKIPTPVTAFQRKTPAPGSKKRNKNPTPGHNLPCSNAKRSMKKEHNSIKAFSFQIFQFSIIVHLTIFFFRENKVFASLYTTLKINTV